MAEAPSVLVGWTRGLWQRRLMVLLAGAALAVTGSQLRLPGTNGLVSPADLLMGLMFLAVFAGMVRHDERAPYSWLLATFLLIYGLTALLAGSGLPGAVETLQRGEHLLGGVVIFTTLYAGGGRRFILAGITLGLIVNLLVAFLQIVTHGAAGPEVTGMFQSRMAFSFYLTLMIGWGQPMWFDWAADKRRRQFLAAALTLAALLMIPHGQFMIIAALLLILLGTVRSRGATLLNVVLVALLVACLWSGSSTWRQELSASAALFRDGRLKQGHVELVAAARMALKHPWTGAGVGRYQENIGPNYGELPNPPFNEIEQDGQSGWGILFGTAGIVTGLLFVGILLQALSRALAGYYGSLKEEPVALAALGGWAALVAGMFISDVFVRGLGWYAALILASAYTISAAKSSGFEAMPAFGWRRVFTLALMLAVLVLFTAVGGDRTPEPATAGPQTPTPPAGQTGGEPASAASEDNVRAETGQKEQAEPVAWNFRRLIAAAEADNVSPPARLSAVESAAGGRALEIPDNSCELPERFEPSLKYGGARYSFKLPGTFNGRIWLRCWWAGSCGNSVFVQVNDSEPVAVGNDGTYMNWHWLPAPSEHALPAGTNTLTILTREDGIRLDQILLTADDQYVPQGVEID